MWKRYMSTGSRSQATTLAVGGKPQVHQVGDGPGGCMVSGYPFGVYEIYGVSQRRSYRERLTRRQELSGDRGCVDVQERWWMVFPVPGRLSLEHNSRHMRQAETEARFNKRKGNSLLLLCRPRVSESKVRISNAPQMEPALRWKRTPSRCCETSTSKRFQVRGLPDRPRHSHQDLRRSVRRFSRAPVKPTGALHHSRAGRSWL